MNRQMDISVGSYEVNVEYCGYQSYYSHPCVYWQFCITAGPHAGLVIYKYNNLTTESALRQWQRELTAFGVGATDLDSIREAPDRIMGQTCQVRVSLNKEGYLQPEIDFEATRRLRVDRLLQDLFAKYGAPDNPAPPAGEDASATSPPVLFPQMETTASVLDRRGP